MYSAVISRMCSVFESNVSVFARTGVVTVCSTTKLVGLFSLITVTVPSPWELNASMVFGLNTAPSVPAPSGRVVQDFAVFRAHDHHGLRLAAGDEQDLILYVHGEPGAGSAFSGQVVMAGDGHGLGVDHRDVVFIFDIDVDVAFSVGDGLFGRAAQVDGAGDGAVFRVDHGGVGSAVAPDIGTLIEGIEEDAVWTAFDVDFLDRRRAFWNRT